MVKKISIFEYQSENRSYLVLYFFISATSLGLSPHRLFAASRPNHTYRPCHPKAVLTLTSQMHLTLNALAATLHSKGFKLASHISASLYSLASNRISIFRLHYGNTRSKFPP
ncbi:hypothetical protein E2C01_035992 [Portunus trituberculatus]|uniref:Uncharacterized protein n=1 Tax=Portunus trituberculatus TaxID=210409 RepID=A0A5B7F5R0_PORTR|nr:hypothetical protein [Portunus trituberculatus]